MLRYCSGRGFGHPAKEDQEQDQKEMPFAISRDEFLTALTQEIKRLIASEDQERVLAVCRRHLRREIRPMRVENRKPSKCAWEGCDRNVRRAKNARRERLQQALFSWLTDIIRRRESPAQLWQALESWIDRALASPKRVPFKARIHAGPGAGLSEAQGRLREEHTRHTSGGIRGTYSLLL